MAWGPISNYPRVEGFLLALGAVAFVATIGWIQGRAAAVVAILALVVLAFFASVLARKATAREGIQGLSAALSSIAVLLAAYWYFIDRRGYPKLNVEPEVRAWPVANGALIVWASVRLTNVGNLAIKFDPEDRTKLLVQVAQVAPLTGSQANGLLREMQRRVSTGTREFRLIQEDRWSALATFEDPIESTIETEETERLYFKAVIPCQDNIVLAVTATVPKSPRLVGNRLAAEEKHAWVGQSLFPTEAKCLS